MTYKYRSLLLNVPCRHMINKMKTTPEEMSEHLKRITRIDLNNIFLLMSVENAQKYLNEANNLGLYGKKYSYFLMTKVNYKI